MYFRKGSMFAAALLGAVALAAPAAMADSVSIFNFRGDTDVSALYPELIYDATTGLSTGPGAISDGGFLSPGLFATISHLPGITQNPPGVGPGPTYNVLSDLTLVLTGFAPVGDADLINPNTLNQNLQGGTFALVHPGLSRPILAGTVQDAMITEVQSSITPGTGDSASVLSGTVTYTDSILADELAAAGFSHNGSLSFSLTGVVGTFGTVTVGGEQHLANFAGDLIGTFDVLPASVPTPAAVWGGFGLVGLLGVARAKKRRAMSA